MRYVIYFISVLVALSSCRSTPKESMSEESLIKLIVLDPGHFHAALVQKQMYKGIDKTVHVYAPEGSEVEDYIQRIEAFNNREETPTSWTLNIYKGEDFLDKMLDENPGNLVVLAGNNRRKTEYIAACIEAGLNVFSDKPMAIDTSDYRLLNNVFSSAQDNRLLVYDIMTERFEITNMLQKSLSNQPGIFGELKKGSAEDPSIIKESVHHFYKTVSGIPLVRPAWFFDITQEGKAIADVGTHLVDLIMLGAGNLTTPFTEEQVVVISSSTGITPLSLEQFQKVTGRNEFPQYLDPYIVNQELLVPANSYLDFKVGDTYARTAVRWDFQAPEGGGDTHFSLMRGTKCDLVIRQGEAQDYKPELYVKALQDSDADEIEEKLTAYLEGSLSDLYPGLSMKAEENGLWRLHIPDSYRVGHEAHFAEVTERFLTYFQLGRMPEWEWQQMLTKYYITTSAAMAD